MRKTKQFFIIAGALLLLAAGVALFTLLVICAAKIVPIVPISELVEKKEAHKLMIYLRTRKKAATTNN